MSSSETLKRFNLMHPIRWVPPDAGSVLDVGCSVGSLLRLCGEVYPQAKLAGVEVDAGSLEAARGAVPGADLRHAGAESLPFPDASFDCVTCIEVLEHVPEELRRAALAEVRRVLKPGGRFVLRVPHAGWFSFLDPNNVRFMAPRLFHALVGRRAMRDKGYDSWSHGVVWHHHFTRTELFDLLGPGWETETVRRGAMLVMPLTGYACWPFYRAKASDSLPARWLHRLIDLDMGIDFGPASYDILLILRRGPNPDAAPDPTPEPAGA